MHSRIQIACAGKLRVLCRLAIHEGLKTIESVSAIRTRIERGPPIYAVGIEAELHRVLAGHDGEVIDELISAVGKLVAVIPVGKPCGLRAVDRNCLDRAPVSHGYLRSGAGIPRPVFFRQFDPDLVDVPI